MFTYIKTIIKKLSNLISNAYYKVRNKVLGKPKTQDLYDFIKDLDTEDTSVILREVLQRSSENRLCPDKFPQLQWESLPGVFWPKRPFGGIGRAGFIETKESILAYVGADAERRLFLSPLTSLRKLESIHEKVAFSYLLDMPIEILYPEIQGLTGVMSLEDVKTEALIFAGLDIETISSVSNEDFSEVLICVFDGLLGKSDRLNESINLALSSIGG